MSDTRHLSAETGSPQGEPVFIHLGRLGRPHGVRGEIRMQAWSESLEQRLQPGTTVYLGEVYHPAVIRSIRPQNDLFLVAFEGYPDRTAVEILRNQTVSLPAEALPPLEEGEIYLYQLIGLQVVTDQGLALGTVDDILETGANDVIVVRDEDGKEYLLPDIEEVVLDVNLEAGQMRVHLLDGLLPGI
ncbi:MAG: ribosome maturation factor RimM [Anaerolineales bacterium]